METSSSSCIPQADDIAKPAVAPAAGPAAAVSEARPTVSAVTPMRLKPPSKIAPVTIKPLIMPGSTVKNTATASAAPTPAPEAAAAPESAPVPAPQQQNIEINDQVSADGVPDSVLSLKRKPEPTTTTTNTRSIRPKVGSAATITTRTALNRTVSTRASSSSSAAGSAAASSRGVGKATPALGGIRANIARGGISKPVPRTASGAARPVGRLAGAAAKEVVAAATASAAAASSSSTTGVKKRPAWDVKGRLADLEENHHMARNQLLESQTTVTTMNAELERTKSLVDEHLRSRRNMENDLRAKERENNAQSEKISALERELQILKRNHDDELHAAKSRLTRELDDVNQTLSTLQRTHANVLTELSAARDESTSLRATVSSQSALSVSMEADARAVKMRLERTEELLREREARITVLEEEAVAMSDTVKGLEAKVREEETIRRKLHNTIQELKGNIRVFCRVRPPLPQEVEEKDGVLSHLSFAEDDEKAIELKQSVESASGQKTIEKTYPFSFDRVFQPGTPQAAVFDEISQLVQSALDGYNVCIFAYGQTGSGKTFTMEGPENALERPEDMGMIPRAVHQVFESAEALREKGWAYEMEAQFLEIYNEAIRDLVATGGQAADTSGKHEIKHHAVTGKTSVTELCTFPVTTPQQVHSILKKASHNRAVAATNCNERSSRSHSVFTLRMTGANALTGESSSGVLNLIDLAGSERLSSSGSTGDRLKETQAINKSLSCLGDVINALANGDKHIPYRNSKLTYLLQSSLGGNSKTLMFVNVSPLATNFQETLCSLRFATKVNTCQIGTAKKLIKA
ncbi:kinesin-like nuclear fusion protein [Geranomyces variabilis]|nr:kinesin-like nuclear fusion protein [Geranomyces variabilis]